MDIFFEKISKIRQTPMVLSVRCFPLAKPWLGTTQLLRCPSWQSLLQVVISMER